MRNYLILLFCLAVAGCSTASAASGKGDFCGRSTYGKCDKAVDCRSGGCSTQLCHSRFDEVLPVVCDNKPCYNAKAYNLSCKCVENKCQWAR